MSNLYITIDTEKGGLDNECSLLTVYLGIFQDKNLIDELYLELIPNDGKLVIEPEGMQVNNIDLRGWQGIKYKDARKILDNFIRKFVYDEKNNKIGKKLIPIGQAVSGDIKDIQKYLTTPERWQESVSALPIDTLTIASFYRDLGILNTKSLSLNSLIQYFELDKTINEFLSEGLLKNEQLHNAKFDAIFTYAVYLKLKQLYNN